MHATPEFAQTRDDLRRLQAVASRRLATRPAAQPIRRLIKIAAWMVIAATLFLFFRLQDRVPEESATLDAIGLLCPAGCMLAVPGPAFVQNYLRGGIVSDNGAFLRTQSLRFSEDGVVLRWATGSAEMQWATFIGKDADDTNHYLFVDASAAYVVPRRVVAGFEADFDRWFARIGSA